MYDQYYLPVAQKLLYIYMITVPTKPNKQTYVMYHVVLTFPMPCMLSRIAGDVCMMSVHIRKQKIDMSNVSCVSDISNALYVE
jgi:hypothetical protein